jgi:hypothetical protein
MIETALAVAFSRCFKPSSCALVGLTASSIRSIGRLASPAFRFAAAHAIPRRRLVGLGVVLGLLRPNFV